MFDFLEFISIVLCVLCGIGLITCLFMLIRVEVTGANQMKILDAIYDYSIDKIHKAEDPLVDFDDMESFDSTYYRLWDFGCKRILPKEKYELIKEYIK